MMEVIKKNHLMYLRNRTCCTQVCNELKLQSME